MNCNCKIRLGNKMGKGRVEREPIQHLSPEEPSEPGIPVNGTKWVEQRDKAEKKLKLIKQKQKSANKKTRMTKFEIFTSQFIKLRVPIKREESSGP